MKTQQEQEQDIINNRSIKILYIIDKYQDQPRGDFQALIETQVRLTLLDTQDITTN